MTWIGWLVLIWVALMLGGTALIGYWIGLHKGAKQAAAQPLQLKIVRTDTESFPVVPRLDRRV